MRLSGEPLQQRVLLRRRLRRLGHSGLLQMAAEGLPHRREDAVAELGLAARGEAVEERGREDRDGHTLVDRRSNRPAALPGIAHAAGIRVEHGRLVQRLRGQVEQPGRDHRAAAPELRHGREIELVAVVIGIAERGRLGIGLLLVHPDVRVLEHVQPLRVRLHDPVLDPVVDHLDEVARPGRTAVEPALLLGGRIAFAAGRPLRRLDAGRECLQDRSEASDRLVVAADHQAVAAREAQRRRR